MPVRAACEPGQRRTRGVALLRLCGAIYGEMSGLDPRSAQVSIKRRPSRRRRATHDRRTFGATGAGRRWHGGLRP